MKEDGHIIFSSKRTNKILTRYSSQKYHGLCYFEINPKVRERLKIMQVLSATGDCHVKNFFSIKATLTNSIKVVFFIPDVEPEYLGFNQKFADSFHTGKLFWYIEKFDTKKLKRNFLIRSRAIFVDVLTDYIIISILPYENKYFSTIAFSYQINFRAIGL